MIVNRMSLVYIDQFLFICYFPECNEVLATFEVFVKSFSGRVADVRDGDGEALGPVRGLT